MQRTAIAATLLSFALVGGGAAQAQTTPATGAAAGAAAGAVTGAAAAGPVGAAVGAATGAATGAVTGTVAAVTGAAFWGAPYGYWPYSYWAYWGYNCPAGYTPVTPPNTLPSNITGIGYCAPAAVAAYVVPTVTVPTQRAIVLRRGERVIYAKATRRPTKVPPLR
jgi:hypothetical protein